MGISCWGNPSSASPQGCVWNRPVETSSDLVETSLFGTAVISTCKHTNMLPWESVQTLTWWAWRQAYQHTSQDQKQRAIQWRRKRGNWDKKNYHLPFLPLGLCKLVGFPWGLCPGTGQHPGAKCPPLPASANSSKEERPTAMESRACCDLSRATDQVTAQLTKEKLSFKKKINIHW